MENSKTQHRLIESDVFLLGITMLHLTETKLPERTSAKRLSELQYLQRKVQTLRYSEELKRLLTVMLSNASGDRPSLETIQRDVERIYRQVTQGLTQEALRCRLQARLNIDEGKNAKAVELAVAAHAIYSRLSEDRDTTRYLSNWGLALYGMGRSSEAAEKYAAAHAIYSRLPDFKDAARNLKEWGSNLKKMGRYAEAEEKYAGAHAILSRLPEDKDAADNLKEWGFAFRAMGRSAEAEEKYAAAQAVLSRLPDVKDAARSLKEWGGNLRKTGMQRRRKSTQRLMPSTLDSLKTKKLPTT